MTKAEIFRHIANAIEAAPDKQRTAELHLQMIRWADDLSDLSGRAFCESVGLGPSFASEFSKMKNIAQRPRAAGLDVSLI